MTANILRLEQDDCGVGSLYVLRKKKMPCTQINIQRLILYHEYRVTISSETICIGLFETFQPQPVAVRMSPTTQSSNPWRDEASVLT